MSGELNWYLNEAQCYTVIIRGYGLEHRWKTTPHGYSPIHYVAAVNQDLTRWSLTSPIGVKFERIPDDLAGNFDKIDAYIKLLHRMSQ